MFQFLLALYIIIDGARQNGLRTIIICRFICLRVELRNLAEKDSEKTDILSGYNAIDFFAARSQIAQICTKSNILESKRM